LRYLQTRFLKAAEDFIATLEKKTATKVFYNIDLAEQTNDPRLFKKLQGEIWEFRTRHMGLQLRLLAFWDKMDGEQTLVIAGNGFVKKIAKVLKVEIDKAEATRKQYFEAKARNANQNQRKN
jgi:hypothetical protein